MGRIRTLRAKIVYEIERFMLIFSLKDTAWNIATYEIMVVFCCQFSLFPYNMIWKDQIGRKA